jgi:SAM-dependent methyltransferase
VRPAGPLSFPFYQCNFNQEELPADLQELELIICSGLLEYIEDLPAFLNQLRVRLRPDGKLIATYFNMNHISRIWALIRGRSFPVRADWRGLYSPRDVARLIRAAGFELTQVLAMNHSIGTAPGVEQTVSTRLTLPRVRPWSRFLSHQFLYVARALQNNEVPLDEINALLPEGARLILVDEAQWPRYALAPRQVIPFIERDGEYWGPPEDDAQAIRELDRLRQGGAEFIVFASPGFWWLDYYTRFATYLRSNFRLVGDDTRMIAFDLRNAAAPSAQADPNGG